MNRLYVVETTRHRPLVADLVWRFVRARWKFRARRRRRAGCARRGESYAAHAEWIAAMARDLQAARGRSIVHRRRSQSPFVHALAHAMNQSLGNVGTTVTYTAPAEANPVEPLQSLRELVADIDAGVVEVQVIVSSNPVYNTPRFAIGEERLRKVPICAFISECTTTRRQSCVSGTSRNRTSSNVERRARLRRQPLRSFSAADLAALQRKSVHEFLAAFTGGGERSSYDIVREFCRTNFRRATFDNSGARFT